MKQKDIFLESEGDEYFRRSSAGGWEFNAETDPIIFEISRLNVAKGSRILEIGCGNGARLAEIVRRYEVQGFGVEPSEEAVRFATLKHPEICVMRGTADRLPFDDFFFDVVVFGFCLYLCDRIDLFRIAMEADRVLKDPGWLAIMDFYSPTHVKRPYHHREGIYSYKMDYRTMFLWHPFYTSYEHRVVHWQTWNTFTDDRSAWAAVAVLRKNSDGHP